MTSGYHTVNSLLEDLTKLKAEGLGDNIIVVSSDDEGNDYRGLLNQDILYGKENVEEYLGEWYEDDEEYDSQPGIRVAPDKIVIL